MTLAINTHSHDNPFLTADTKRWGLAFAVAFGLELLLLSMLAWQGEFSTESPKAISVTAVDNPIQISLFAHQGGSEALDSPRQARFVSQSASTPTAVKTTVNSSPIKTPAPQPTQTKTATNNIKTSTPAPTTPTGVVSESHTAIDTKTTPTESAIASANTQTTSSSTSSSNDNSAINIVSNNAATGSGSGSSSASNTTVTAESSGNSGRGGGNGNGVATGHPYFATLKAWLNRYKTYPSELKKAKRQGTVVISFTINRHGELVNAQIVTSSGEDGLDQAALRMLQRANPMPPLPSELGLNQLSLTIPVEYSLITR